MSEGWRLDRRELCDLDSTSGASEQLSHLRIRKNVAVADDSSDDEEQVVDEDDEFILQVVAPYLAKNVSDPGLSRERNTILRDRVHERLLAEIRALYSKFQQKRKAHDSLGMFRERDNATRMRALFRVELQKEVDFMKIRAGVLAEVRSDQVSLRGPVVHALPLTHTRSAGRDRGQPAARRCRARQAV
jgi:hypothetical protein